MDGNPRSTRLKHRKENNSNVVGDAAESQSMCSLG